MILTLKIIVEHAGFADFIYNLAYKENDSIIIVWNNGETKVGKTISTAYDSVQFSSVAQSCPTQWPYGLQHARLLCPSPTPRACSKSCPLSQWCHPYKFK